MKVRQLVEADYPLEDQIASVKRDIIEYIKKFAKRERIEVYFKDSYGPNSKGKIDVYTPDEESYVTSATFKPFKKLKKELERKFGDHERVSISMKFKEYDWSSPGWRDDSEGGGDTYADLHLLIHIR